MLHIRLTFIGIQTGWAPKISAGPLETKKFGSPAGPWRKNVKLCPCTLYFVRHYNFLIVTYPNYFKLGLYFISLTLYNI